MNYEYQPPLQLQQTEPSPPIPAPVPKTFLRYSNKPAKDFFDKFRHEELCTVPATSRYKKQDAFLAVRPKDGTCLDYHISETDTKLDAGLTKIHIRQVNATYEPLPPKVQEVNHDHVTPPKKRKRNPFHNKYCHAKEPVFEFAEEKYARKVMRDQEFYKRKFEEGIGIIKKSKKFKKYNEHDNLLELSGPDWFIELSPIQKETADNLLDAIQHDLRFGEVTETCCILGRLGLLLRPNRKLVEIALKKSCKCPVEFLLTLYQLMNPNRIFYSLNDMLILSSVVHLTLKNTLKEMHIRLPSPPPPLERKATKPKRPKKCTYESPYLEPVLLIRSKSSDIGTLENQYLTFPKSPYFAYLKELHELRYPTYSTRNRFPISKEKVSTLPSTLTLHNELLAAQAAYNKMHEYYEHEKVNLLQASIYYNCKKRMQSTSDRSNLDCNIESGEKDITEQFSTVVLVANTSKIENTTVEITETEEIDERNERTMDMCQCHDEQGSSPESDVSSNPSDSILDKGHIVPAEEINNVDEGACVCTNRSSEGSTGREIDKAENKEERGLVEIKKRTPSNCICRQIIEKRIEESTCQCMKCKEDMEKKNIKTTYVIYDTKVDLDGPIPIISDVKAERKCTCLERYLKKVNRIDYKKEIRRAHEHLIDIGQPFIINGVAIGPDGKPIYNLSAGVAVKSTCRCLTQPKPPDASKLGATMPMGRQKYAISGIQSSPEGNVFIVSGAIPIEPCCCMEMYKEYVRQHDKCLKIYEAYLNKIKYDTEEYMDDLRNRNIVEDAESRTSSSVENGEQSFECGPITETAEEFIVPTMDKSSDHGSGDYVNEKQVCLCKVEEKSEEEEEEEEAAEEEEEEEEEPKTDLIEDDLSEYARYIILRHIPTNSPEQIDLIKQLLHLLALDDYPLAKLPDCHKLPIFKLWMAKKTHVHWTYNDRLRTLKASKGYWTHISNCRANRTKNITLGLSNTDANNFTWFDSKIVKDYTSKRRYNYQSEQRQASVAAAREFFPSLFMYENYSTRFRDLYFAYMPSKEEDVFYHNVWRLYEYRNLIMSRQDAKVYRCSILA